MYLATCTLNTVSIIQITLTYHDFSLSYLVHENLNGVKKNALQKIVCVHLNVQWLSLAVYTVTRKQNTPTEGLKHVHASKFCVK